MIISTRQKRLIFFITWCVITACISVFGQVIMDYLQYIIGLRTMRFLSGGAGIFVVLVLLGGALHFITHWVTLYRR